MERVNDPWTYKTQLRTGFSEKERQMATDLDRLTKIDPKGLSREQLEALVRAKVSAAPAEPVEPAEPVIPVVAVPTVPADTREAPIDPTKPAPMTATKAWAGGGGAALGAALAEILVLLMPRLRPAEVALNIVLSTAVAFAATYWAPANRIVR